MLETLWWCQLGASFVYASVPPVQARYRSVPAGHGASSVPARSPPVPARSPPVLSLSLPVPARSPPVPARCRLGPRRSRCLLCPLRCLLGSHRCRFGSRAFHVYPDQISSTPNGSISIDSPELRLHPGNASISLPWTLRVHIWAIPVQLLQSQGVLGSSPAPAPDLTPWLFPTHAKQFRIRSFENEITIQ